MATSVQAQPWAPNRKTALTRSLHVRYAEIRHISPETAADHFLGRTGPVPDVVLMSSVAGQFDRPDIVERWIARIRGAALPTLPDYWKAKCAYDHADGEEDMTQAAFDELVRTGQATEAHARKRIETMRRERSANLVYELAIAEKFGLR